MTHTTNTTDTYRPTRITTSQGVRLTEDAYTTLDLAVWLDWARRVTSHPMTRQMGTVADAKARLDRLCRGEVWDMDISGLQDWAEAEVWDIPSSIRDLVARGEAEAFIGRVADILGTGRYIDHEDAICEAIWMLS